MEETKPWWSSRTIWASILQVGVGVAVSLGLFSDTAGGAILADGPDLIIGVVTGLLGAWGLYGRVKATKTLTGV